MMAEWLRRCCRRLRDQEWPQVSGLARLLDKLSLKGKRSVAERVVSKGSRKCDQ